MDLVFTTENLPRTKRYDAWRAAICDCYVHVDVKAKNPETYKGFIREARFGDVVLTDILLSEQSIRRNAQHISRLDKDCYYLQLLHRGSLTVLQRGASYVSNPARGAIFSATEQYELRCSGEVRSLYLEIPRDEFARRFPSERIPLSATINSSQGLGRITTEFCAMLSTESSKLDPNVRQKLGGELMDVLAVTLQAAEADMPSSDGSIQGARLRSVKQWIENHLGDPDVSLERIARANGMSVRYLHQLFQLGDVSVSEWIWDRRLQLSYDEIARADGRLITTIAFDHGFNSSAHFSTMFRRKYGMSPRDLAKLHRPQ